MPRAREDPERTRGILALIASLALFVLLNGDLLTNATTFVVKTLGWDMIKRIMGVIIPLSIVAASAPQVSKIVEDMRKRIKDIMTKIENGRRAREARAIMSRIYGFREECSRR